MLPKHNAVAPKAKCLVAIAAFSASVGADGKQRQKRMLQQSFSTRHGLLKSVTPLAFEILKRHSLGRVKLPRLKNRRGAQLILSPVVLQLQYKLEQYRTPVVDV